MFVRTIYAVGDPAKIDTAVEALKGEGRTPLVQQVGFRGMGLFVDRELGKLLTGTWWDSEKARKDSDDALRDQRMAILMPFTTSVAVDDYEVVADHRAETPQPGAGFRMSRMEFDPFDADLVAETFRGTALERLTAIPGVIGASLFINRAAGRAAAGVVYKDHAALAASRSAQAAVRDEATGKAHLTVRSVEEFEMVFTDMVQPA
jgi:hypothetical protein